MIKSRPQLSCVLLCLCLIYSLNGGKMGFEGFSVSCRIILQTGMKLRRTFIFRYMKIESDIYSETLIHIYQITRLITMIILILSRRWISVFHRLTLCSAAIVQTFAAADVCRISFPAGGRCRAGNSFAPGFRNVGGTSRLVKYHVWWTTCCRGSNFWGWKGGLCGWS
jgi:hypothetical protein